MADNSQKFRDLPLKPRPASFAGSLPSLDEAVGASCILGTKQKRHSAPHPIVPKLFHPKHTKFVLDGQQLVCYEICGKPYTMQQPQNEGVATFARQTINGRTLSYRLKVVQQPEKARACGSGPRSSADRRPVDPPPVVKLTIYDGNKDITLSYDAGFMLYASLDVARPIASGRMHSGQIVPVLTGVAVAGVAYLERPKQAGYFIFPDLSVRHEGWYRLRFHLFEQVKHAEDADQDRPFEQAPSSSTEQPHEPVQHEAMANRMYVYSAPFQVFSAKKFPGLNTSTELSKVVADQGCRVRIRREIRQRRKPKGKDDDEDLRKSVHGTPEPIMRPIHDRSLSRDGLDASRRVSLEATQQQMLSRRPSNEHLTATTPRLGAAPVRPHPVVTGPAANPYPQPEMRSVFRPEDENKIYTPTPQQPPSALPRTITPSVEHVNLTLPPIQSFYDSSTATRPRSYDLPEPTPQKRSYSPRTYAQDSSLKDGARPDATRSHPPAPPALVRQRSSSTLSWVMNSNEPQPKTADGLGGIIEADTDPYGSDSEDSLLDGPFVYRRADGTKSGKPLIMPGRY